MEADEFEVIAPGAFDGCDGQVVPVSVGGLGGPVVGQGVVRATEDGAVVEVQVGGPQVPSAGGMSFAFRMPDDEATRHRRSRHGGV